MGLELLSGPAQPPSQTRCRGTLLVPLNSLSRSPGLAFRLEEKSEAAFLNKEGF